MLHGARSHLAYGLGQVCIENIMSTLVLSTTAKYAQLQSRQLSMLNLSATNRIFYLDSKGTVASMGRIVLQLASYNSEIFLAGAALES